MDIGDFPGPHNMAHVAFRTRQKFVRIWCVDTTQISLVKPNSFNQAGISASKNQAAAGLHHLNLSQV